MSIFCESVGWKPSYLFTVAQNLRAGAWLKTLTALWYTALYTDPLAAPVAPEPAGRCRSFGATDGGDFLPN